ncbi:MAG: FKBP-type peptidyl-prolyl cis-trans isomerase [Bdellovibrionaceae bacterium]|nr:FKBP-type peptidyl-prolyl cis-trans isomerase [Pseudobdellovibrionaceae bacterium]
MRITAFIFASLFFMALASAQTEAAPPATKPATVAPKKTEPAKNPSDPKRLMIEDIVIGKGKPAIKGKSVKVHYTGWLYDTTAPGGKGRQIDSSLKRNEPWSFLLGAGKVIKGWDEGFKDMKVGGKRRLIIPSDMAYGKRGARTEVPPNAPLIFEVELLDVIESTM